MEIHKGTDGNSNRFILLDAKMRLVKPVNMYLEYQQLRGRSENTLKAYAQDLKMFFTFLEQRGLCYDKVNASMIQEYMEYLRLPKDSRTVIFAESERTASTINRMIGTIYGFYCYQSVVNGIQNPIISVTSGSSMGVFKDILYHTRKSNRTKHSVFTAKESGYQVHLFTDSEIQAMYSALPTVRDRIIFRFLLQSGARISEALSLKIEDIPVPDFSKSITVLHGIQSKGKCRDIYIPTELAEELDRYVFEYRLRIETEHNYLFVSQHPHQHNRPISYRGLYEVFKRAGNKVGIDFKFHDTRHTFVTRLVESGMDFSVVRILAGHEHISTTQKYVTLSTEFIAGSLASYWASVMPKGDEFHG